MTAANIVVINRLNNRKVFLFTSAAYRLNVDDRTASKDNKKPYTSNEVEFIYNSLTFLMLGEL